jgi:hypothetical protein
MNTNKALIKFLIISTFICIIFTFGYQAKAQNGPTLIGRILDKETKETLPFATISIPQSQTGVVSNESGEFQYHIPENFEKSVVEISYVGYKTIKINVFEIESGKLVTFEMESQMQQLQEVDVIRKRSKTEAVDIVNKAISNIRKNYPREKTKLNGYYRDYIRPAWSDSCKNLIEAALVIEDGGFQTPDFKRTKISLEQLRYNPSLAIDSSLNRTYNGKNKFIPYVGLAAANELAILRAHDPIRNHNEMTFSYVDIYDHKFTPNHNFHYESITEDDSTVIYCIRFDKHTKNASMKSEYWVDGQIFISSKSFAILKFNYTVKCNTPSYTGILFDLKLEYKNYQDNYYLNYLSLMNYFVFKNESVSGISKTVAPVIPYFQYRELFINKVVNEAFTPMKPHQAINKSASLLTNKIPVIEGFWENYNYPGNLNLVE